MCTILSIKRIFSQVRRIANMYTFFFTTYYATHISLSFRYVYSCFTHTHKAKLPFFTMRDEIIKSSKSHIVCSHIHFILTHRHIVSNLKQKHKKIVCVFSIQPFFKLNALSIQSNNPHVVVVHIVYAHKTQVAKLHLETKKLR